MKRFFIILLLSVAGVFAIGNSYGQRIFTLKSTCSSANPFTDANCWDVSGSCSTSARPTSTTTISGTSSCPIEVVITKDLNFTGDLTLGGNVTLRVLSGVDLSISGSIIVQGETQNNFLDTQGGTITATEIELKNGKSSPTTNLGIKGNGVGGVTVTDIEVSQNVILDILDNGSLKVTGTTNYSGNSSQINVYGGFETNQVIIAGGGKGVELNAFGDANVNILGDLEIRGESTIVFGGNSNINVAGDIKVNGNTDLNSETGGLFLRDNTSLTVGGDINIVGNAAIVMEDNAEALVTGSVFISGSGQFNMGDSAILIVEGGCGTYEDVTCEGGLFLDGSAEFNESGLAQAYICGQKPEPNIDTTNVDVTVYCIPGDPNSIPGQNCALYTSCRVLAVIFDQFGVKFNQNDRTNTIEFSTSSEKDNSHFIIERSINGVKNFEPIGEINGSAWSDSKIEYSFLDNNIPLLGGNIFYRVKQVDFSGNFIYSEVFANRVNPVAFTSGVWRTYPNPVIDQNLAIGLLDPSSYSGGEITIRMIHPLQSTPFFTSDNLEEINAQLRSWISGFPSGVLIAEIQWEGKMDHLKVLKKD